MSTPPWEEMALLVTELAVQTSDGDGHDGPPLLTQLRRAVWGDVGRTVAGAGGNGLPLNIGAHIVWTDLVDEVGCALSQVTGANPTPSTLVNLLAWHATFGMLIGQGYIDELMQATALDKLRAWAQRIRDQFDAPMKIELRGLACPNCGEDRAEWWDRDLLLSGSAIVVTLDEELRLVASCRNKSCHHHDGEHSVWEGDKEVLYMARTAGIDVDALADEIRVARQNVPDTYVEPDVKVTITPEHPHYRAVLAQMGEA